MLAMPRGISGRDTAVLSRPILEDEKVVEMVRKSSRILMILHLDLKLCIGVHSLFQFHTCPKATSLRYKSNSPTPRTNALPKIDKDETPKSNRNNAASGKNNHHLPSKKAKRKPSYLTTTLISRHPDEPPH